MKNNRKNYSADDYKNSNCIVKEAQSVIDDYIKRHDSIIRVGCSKNHKIESSRKSRIKLTISPFLIFNLVVFALITTFLYILSKAI